MKKFIFTVMSLVLVSSAHAETSVLANILSSPEVANALIDVDAYTVKFNAVNTSTTWTYTAVFSYNKLGGDSAGSTKKGACILTAKVVSIGGISGTQTSPVQASEVCSM